MESLLLDVRFATRSLLRTPQFAAIVVATLALGIGTSTAIFSVIDGVLLRPLPYDEPDSLVYVGVTALRPSGETSPFSTSVPDFAELVATVDTLTGLAAAEMTSLVLLGDGEPQRVETSSVSAGVFETFGIIPVVGNVFTPEDYEGDADPVLLVSHGVWQRRWGADPAIVGQSILTADGPHRLAGVLPPDFEPPAALRLVGVEVLLPLRTAGRDCITCYTVSIAARLADGVDLEAARQELHSLGEVAADRYPEHKRRDDFTMSFGAVPLLEQTVGDRGPELFILFGASGMLLLIGCSNVANLLLTRAADRGGELALRAALGAGKRRIVRQLLTESLVLAFVGSALGVGVAAAGVAAFRVLGPDGFPRLASIHLDPRALAFTGSIAVLTGVVFGLAPALLSARRDVSAALREVGSKGSASRSRSRFRNGLVCAEIALATVLLAGAGLLVNSYARLSEVAPGFVSEHLLMTEVGLGDAYATDAARAALFTELVQRTASLPGVVAASAVADPPIGYTMWTPPVFLEGASDTRDPGRPAHLVMPGYFRTMGIRLMAGRVFSADDSAEMPMVAVVNESMATQLWPGEPAIGKRFRTWHTPETPWFTVVGIVNDVHQEGLADATGPEFYVSYPQSAWFPYMTLVVRTEQGAAALAPLLRGALHEVDPQLPLDSVSSFAERVSESLRTPRFRTWLLLSFAVMALLLASGGIYGSTLYAVSRRTHEVGIRVALGARPAEIVRLMLSQGVRLTIAGVAIGLVAAYWLSALIAAYLYEVPAGDPATLGLVGAVLSVVAIVACFFPALRATRLDPLLALRSEG